MKWVNHIAIGASTAAVINPILVPLAALGATAPDWLEWVSKALGRPVKHRTTTHMLVVWVVFLGAAIVFDPVGLVTAFAWGGLTHILCDALTVSGVPFSPYSDRRFHLFGGRLRTGDPAEYVISFGVVFVCAGFVLLFTRDNNGWMPFFYDWMGLYNEGVISGHEWRTNRFRFF